MSGSTTEVTEVLDVDELAATGVWDWVTFAFFAFLCIVLGIIAWGVGTGRKGGRS